MATPLSRDTTYLNGLTPYIKAADLNRWQDYLVHCFQGTRTFKKLQCDGTSDAVTTVADGAVMVSHSIAGTAAVPAGQLSKEMLPRGGCIIDSGGARIGSFGVDSYSRGGAGNYTITWQFVPPATSEFRTVVLLHHQDGAAWNADEPRIVKSLQAVTNYLVTQILLPNVVDRYISVMVWAF